MTNRAVIYYCSVDLDAAGDRRFSNAMQSLAGILQQTPLELEVPVVRLTDELRASVIASLDRREDMTDRVSELVYELYDRFGWIPPLTLACPSDHRWAAAVKRSQPAAEWGANSGTFSLIYEWANPFAVWHESLHTLSAEDCYRFPDHPQPLCERPNCIMQYIPSASSVGSWPFLCEANIRRVKERVALLQHASEKLGSTRGSG